MSRFRPGPLPCLPWANAGAWWVGHVPWWWPVPLFARKPDPFIALAVAEPTHRQIGWVYGQRAALTHNLHSGWIAFLEDQTEENLRPRCEKCGKECGE